MIDEQANGVSLTDEDIAALLASPGDTYIDVRLEKYGFDWTDSQIHVAPQIDDMAKTSTNRLLIVSHTETTIYVQHYLFGEQWQSGNN